MSDPKILAYMSRMSSEKLIEILEARNLNEWVEESFLAAEEILIRRGSAPPISRSAEQRNHAVMTCVSCSTELRIPITEGKYRCPKCQISYALRLLSSSPLIYLIVQAEPTKTSSQPPPPTRETPKKPSAEVLSAFSLLELAPNSTLIEARANYRKMIQSCHPDKVSHLDKEIKALAELKTKKLNEAILVITSFFKSQ